MAMTPEKDLLISDWFRRVRESQRVHHECGNLYSRFHRMFGIPTIVITATVGTTVFATINRQAIGSTACLGPSECGCRCARQLANIYVIW